MRSIMDTFRVDDLPLESKVVTEALDKVQQQVEAYYYDIRQKVIVISKESRLASRLD
jgi:preprotein translocase subunit SecA